MILIIDNYDSFTYNLYQAVAVFEHEIKVIRNDQITIDEIRKLDPRGIILSPGPGRPEPAGICIDVIQAFSPHIPILGVCLGHQAIGVAFGGCVDVANEIVHGKATAISHNGCGIYANLPSPLQVGRYHSLIVKREHLPAVLQVEAESPCGLIMGIKHIKFPTYGVQFHPESILTPDGNLLLRNFGMLC